ncbi:MAG: hypothetical protein IJ174_04460, partial [Clostridia bacterium]|nr:hypothetical protein [Clostridia bacterium]
ERTDAKISALGIILLQINQHCFARKVHGCMILPKDNAYDRQNCAHSAMIGPIWRMRKKETCIRRQTP